MPIIKKGGKTIHLPYPKKPEKLPTGPGGRALPPKSAPRRPKKGM